MLCLFFVDLSEALKSAATLLESLFSLNFQDDNPHFTPIYLAVISQLRY